MKIFLNGRITPESDATIPAGDHGFLYGAAVFETFRTWGGRLLLLEEHMNRLKNGCDAFGIVPGAGSLTGTSPPYSALRNTIHRLLVENGLEEAVFRLTISAGEGPPGSPGGPYLHPVEIIFVRPLPVLAGSIQLHLLQTSRNEPETTPRPKSANYANSLIGRRELIARGAAPGDEGLMLTSDGRISEGTVSNVFLVSSTGIATPSDTAHILPGITRNMALQLARTSGLAAIETDLRLADLEGAEAIFVTNSIRGIIPVHLVSGKNGEKLWSGDSARHPVVEELIAASPFSEPKQGESLRKT